jgi:transposase-like protein
MSRTVQFELTDDDMGDFSCPLCGPDAEVTMSRRGPARRLRFRCWGCGTTWLDRDPADAVS